MDNIVCYHSQEEGLSGHTGPHWATQGHVAEAPGSVRRQREMGENTGRRLSCGFYRKAREGVVSRLRIG